MRKFILLILSCLSASAAHVQFFFSDFTTATPPLTNRVLFIIPTNNNPPWVDGNVIITGDRNAYTNDGSACITVSNMVAANYFCLIRGPFRDTGFTIAVPDTNALLNANQLRGLVTNGSPSLAYSQAQSDARYVRKTNSWSTGQALTNATFRGSTNAFTFTNGVSSGQFLSTDGTYWFPVTVAPGGGSGEVNTSSNTGDGVGIAAPKSTYDLPFKSFKSANGMATWATNGTNITLTIDLTSTTNVFARTTELNSASNSLVTQITSATNTLAASGRTELNAASNSLVTTITSATNTLAASGRSELNAASNHLELVKQPASANLTNWSGVTTQTFARITDLDNASNHLELVKQPASSTLTNLSNTGAITNVSDAGNAFISLIYTSNNFTIKLATFQAGANVWVTNNGTNLVIAGHSTNGLSRMLSFDANQFSVVSGTNIVVKSGALLTNANTFGLTNQGAVNFSGTFTNFGNQTALGTLAVSGALSSDTFISTLGGIQAAGDIVSTGGNIISDTGFGSFSSYLYVGENFELNGASGDIVKLHGVVTSFPAANSEGFLHNDGAGAYDLSTLPLTNTVNDGIGSGQIAITNGIASQKGKFKSLSAGSNVTLTDQGTNIAIAASSGSADGIGFSLQTNAFGGTVGSASNYVVIPGASMVIAATNTSAGGRTNSILYNTIQNIRTTDTPAFTGLNIANGANAQTLTVTNAATLNGIASTIPLLVAGAASAATNLSEIWSNGASGVMMQNVDSNGWTRIYTRNTNAAPQDGLTLVNSNAQNQSGIPVYSPALRLRGYGRKTSITAGDQPVDWRIYNQPVDASAAPTANLLFGYAVNDGNFTTEFTFGSAGAFTSVGAITASGGAITASGTSSGTIICGTSAGFIGGTANATAPQMKRNAAGWDFMGGDGTFHATNNAVFGGQVSVTNFQNGGWTQLVLPLTNNTTVNLPTNNASFNTIAPSGQNNIALGKGWTNNLGARADMVISVKYVDAATGDPALAFTNTITGEAWTNNVAFGITATYTELLVIPDISPSDYGSFTDLSGTGASITFMKAWWKLK